ncbi:hypothetical protein F4678DRAFT_456522 [Xylaria arbuscula]|nr:hypothetical protein F4678DRAFT_456522 [Xylaria arbuscula]
MDRSGLGVATCLAVCSEFAGPVFRSRRRAYDALAAFGAGLASASSTGFSCNGRFASSGACLDVTASECPSSQTGDSSNCWILVSKYGTLGECVTW